jgi:SagB-type dehydrogenase family enzyme
VSQVARPEQAPVARAIQLEDRLESIGERLPATIVERRSTRRFQPVALALETVAKILSFGYGIARGEPRRCNFELADWLDTYLIVHRVKGLEAGVYTYDSRRHTLVLRIPGDFHLTTSHCCLGQELGRDAACVVVHTADLAAVIDVAGERAYRPLTMTAGNIGQRLNLAATYLRAGASGIGGYLDDEVNALLGLSPRSAILYLTVLGSPHSG